MIHLLSLNKLWLKASFMGYQVRIELTIDDVVAKFVNLYTTLGAPNVSKKLSET